MAAPRVEIIDVPYCPRPLQDVIHEGMDTHRFGAVVCHRRFGKTVLALNHLQRAAVECRRERPRFAFIGPTYSQAKGTSWDYLTHYAAPIPDCKVSISELSVTYANGGQVRLFGADNPDSLRGFYFDGVVFDEYGLQPPRIFTEVIRPALSDRQGWALFLGTPAGKNEFYEVVQQAKQDPSWFFAEYKASQTGIIPAEELAAARKDMTDDEYAQEYECSFEASVKGAIYAAELTASRAAGRVVAVPYEPILAVDTAWDLGVGDATAIWFVQSTRSGEVRIIDYYEASGEGLPHYAQVLTNKGYTYGTHWAPHDIAVKEFSSGRSRLETARSLGITFQIAPNVSIDDGIHAARMLFPRCWFDEAKCHAGLEALQHYRRDYNSRLHEFKPTPVHDWACFSPETEVLTRSGTCRIIDLPSNGEVLTPCGWKQYEGPKLTRLIAPLVEVEFTDGYTVKCTPDHLFLTENGWTSASCLLKTSRIHSCSIASPSISMDGSIASGPLSAIYPRVVELSIVPSGVPPLGRFLMSATSITATSAPQTIGSRTWNVSQPMSTLNFDTRRKISAGLPLEHGAPLLNGIDQRLVESGTDAMQNGPRVGQNGIVSQSLASIAAWFRRCWLGCLATPKSIAPRPVKPLRIVRVTNLDEASEVWCIHVPNIECFCLANGAVVHNSHGADAFRYLAVSLRPPREASTLRVPKIQTGATGWMG